MTLNEYLAEVKARASKATKGPWIANSVADCKRKLIVPTCLSADYDDVDRDAVDVEIDFVCHSRTDIDKLVKIVEMATDCLERLNTPNHPDWVTDLETTLADLDKIPGAKQ